MTNQLIPLSPTEKRNKRLGIGKQSKYWVWVDSKRRALTKTTVESVRALSGNYFMRPNCGYEKKGTQTAQMERMRAIQWAYWKICQREGRDVQPRSAHIEEKYGYVCFIMPGDEAAYIYLPGGLPVVQMAAE